MDLARLLAPYGVLPRRWRSSLFPANHSVSGRCICTTLLAEAFAAINYPVALLDPCGTAGMTIRWSPRLATPRDFAHSPYFEHLEYGAG